MRITMICFALQSTTRLFHRSKRNSCSGCIRLLTSSAAMVTRFYYRIRSRLLKQRLVNICIRERGDDVNTTVGCLRLLGADMDNNDDNSRNKKTCRQASIRPGATHGHNTPSGLSQVVHGSFLTPTTSADGENNIGSNDVRTLPYRRYCTNIYVQSQKRNDR
jgi:hypothetical protein